MIAALAPLALPLVLLATTSPPAAGDGAPPAAAPAGIVAPPAAPAALPPPAPQPAADDGLTVTELRPGVHLLAGGGDGNVLVVLSGEQALVVDGRAPAGTEATLARVEQLAAGRRLSFLVVTHWHDDHVGLDAALAARGAVVVAHAATRAAMAAPRSVPELDWHSTPAPEAALPALTVAGDATLHVGDLAAHLLHLPAAHTGGDLAVHLPAADVLAAGDVFEVSAWPFLDLWHGGSSEGMIAAVDRLLAVAGDDTLIVPGHGPPQRRSDLLAYREVLATVRARVAADLAEGRPPEETIATATTGLQEGRGDGRRFATLVHLDLARRR